jgi:hypothetical protein
MSPETKKELRYQLWGWILFTICALLYFIASIRSGDILFTAASFVFLAACVVFMIPIVKNLVQGNDD